MSNLETMIGLANVIVLFVTAPYFMLYLNSYMLGAPDIIAGILSVAGTSAILILLGVALLLDSYDG